MHSAFLYEKAINLHSKLCFSTRIYKLFSGITSTSLTGTKTHLYTQLQNKSDTQYIILISNTVRTEKCLWNGEDTL